MTSKEVEVYGHHGTDPSVRERKPRQRSGKPVDLSGCHVRPNDQAQRFEPLRDGHGRRAKTHVGSDCEANPEDDVVDTGMVVCATRDYTEFLVEDDGKPEEGAREPDILDELLEMEPSLKDPLFHYV